MDLHNNPIFMNLNETQLDNFMASCEEKDFSSGTQIITRGDQGENVYFLLDGELSVLLPEGQKEHEVARLHPPAVVGEMEMLTGMPRSASVVAITTSKLLVIPIETFEHRIQDGDPAMLKVIANLARVLAFRLGALNEKLLEMEAFVPKERSVELQQFRSKLFSDWSA